MTGRSDRFGTWELESIIAVGGMAEVWSATRDDTHCALKRIHSHLQRNADVVAMFAREQAVTTTLPPHPHVIRGLEHGAVDERPYLALSLAPGKDLRVPDDTRTVARAIAIVRAAAAGAAHLHAHGYVHGDLCPGNLVVDGASVVIVDLGIVRAIGEGGPMRGTHAYMAPEQVRGEAWTPATDVFALGVVLWELVMHARLFHRGPPWLTIGAVIEHVPGALPDPALDAIVQAALAKDPEARTPTARTLDDALAMYTGGAKLHRD